VFEDLAPFDAVLSSTALNWLTPGELVSVYQHVAALVRSGGILLNAEHLLVGPPAHQLGALTERLRQRLSISAAPNCESWQDWWAAARAELRFASLLAERAEVFADQAHHEHINAQFHEAALALAGFSETGIVCATSTTLSSAVSANPLGDGTVDSCAAPPAWN